MLNQEHLATVPLHKGLRIPSRGPHASAKGLSSGSWNWFLMTPEKGGLPFPKFPLLPPVIRQRKKSHRFGRTRPLIPQSKGKTLVLREEPLSRRGFLTRQLSQHPSYTWTQRQGQEQTLKWSEALISHALVLLRVHVWMLSRFSRVWLFATSWTVAHRAPLSMGQPWACRALLQGIFPNRDGTGISYISCIGRWVLYH